MSKKMKKAEWDQTNFNQLLLSEWNIRTLMKNRRSQFFGIPYFLGGRVTLWSVNEHLRELEHYPFLRTHSDKIFGEAHLS